MIASGSLSVSSLENVECRGLEQSLSEDMSVLSKKTITPRVLNLEQEHKIRIRPMIRSSGSKVPLTTGAWSSIIFQGCLCIAAHWISPTWQVCSAILQFERFMTPHTAKAFCALIRDTFTEWGLTKSMSCVTTGSAADMKKSIMLLRQELRKEVRTISAKRFSCALYTARPQLCY